MILKNSEAILNSLITYATLQTYIQISFKSYTGEMLAIKDQLINPIRFFYPFFFY